MQSLLKQTRAYGLIKTEEARGELSHAYLLLLDDARNLRDALKTFVKPFFSCSEEATPEEKRRSALIDNETFCDCLFFPEIGKKFMVEDAERITEESALKPVEGEKKAFVIADFDSATPAAQNKLLKLLEEPPEGVVFLLGATTAYPVLPTVLSRVKTIEIPPFATEEIKDCLARNYGGRYEMNDYELCAAASNGSLGAAQSTLDSGAYKQLIDEAFSLCLSTSATLPQIVKKVGDTKRKKELLSLLRILYRDALLLKTAEARAAGKESRSLAKKISLKSETGRLQTLANTYALSALVFAQEAISKAEKEVTFNAYFPQCLELLIASVQAKGK
ncbi:MAG: hypothetical protein J6B56_01145 [Clostridia bacterium]|nr:hypothetical protein [Clostridia bacterium]